jgi:hypothetical protein
LGYQWIWNEAVKQNVRCFPSNWNIRIHKK